MAADDQPWDMTQTDAPPAAAPPPTPSAVPAAGGSPNDYNAIMQRYIQQLLQQPTLPQPDTTPVTRGLLSRLGEALGGGQTIGVMSPAQQEMAGLRALQHFGTSLIAGSGYHPGQPALGAFATGFQGAEQSERGSEQGAAATLAAQQQYAAGQQQQYLERLKMALPLLQMQRAGAVPNVLASGSAVPGTASGAGTPGGGGVAGPLTAYGKGGPAATVPVPPEYMPLFEAASKRTGVPVDLLIAQARQESGFNPGATGGAGEVGIMQIHPKTATDPGFGLTGVKSPDTLRDPASNINFGADYLAARAKAVGADLSTPEGQAKALQAYNGGGDPNYVQNVTRYMPAPAAPYNVATVGNAIPPPPSGSTTAPAATPPAPSQPPPVASTAPSGTPAPDTRPDDALTWEEFQARHGTPITAATRPDLVVPVDPQSEQQLQSAMAQAKHDVDYAIAPADKTKAQAQYTDASSKLATLRQDAAAKTAANVLAAQKQQGELLSPLYQEAKKLAQAPILKKQEGDQAIQVENIKAGNNYHQQLDKESAEYAQANTIKPMSEQALKAHQMNNGLSQLLPVMQDLPAGGGLVGSILDAHPDMAPLLDQAGVITDRQADATRLVNGLVASISSQMKPTGLGALREYEWNAFKAQLPSLLSTAQGQQKAVVMLMNMNNRIQDEGNWMNNYFNRQVPDQYSQKPGATRTAHNLDLPSDSKYLSPQQMMDEQLGPIVPSYTPPKGTPVTASGQAQWEQSLPPGKPYYKTYAVPDPKNPGQPKRDSAGNVVTTKSLEVRPWQ